MQSSPIAIVGNINLDLKTSLIGSSPGILADGETGVQKICESLGGGGANTALAAARLGGRVHFFGCVGADDLGDRLEAVLGDEGIVPHLARKPTVTGRSINLNWASGRRHFISSLPNNRAMTLADIDVDRLIGSGCTQLLRADVWFSEAMLAEGNYSLLRQVRAAGIETYLDINWDPEWSVPANGARIRERRGQLNKVLPFIHYVHGNERELACFTGCEDIRDACRSLLDCGSSEVVVHRGSSGAASFTAAQGWLEVPASPVAQVVSSTGCEDVFCAAHMLSSGLEIGERLRACAAIAADHLSGVRTLIPRLDDPNPTRTFTAQFLSETKQILDRLPVANIERMAHRIAAVRQAGGRLFVLGLGGSAANASHMVNDFRKLAGIETYAPTDNVSELTARINDEGWDGALASWLRVSRLAAADAVLVLSVGGGNSERNISTNLVVAMHYARSVGASISGIVGSNGGYTAQVADECVVVPTVNPEHVTPHSEALQAVVWHLLVSHPKLKPAPTKWEPANQTL